MHGERNGDIIGRYAVRRQTMGQRGMRYHEVEIMELMEAGGGGNAPAKRVAGGVTLYRVTRSGENGPDKFPGGWGSGVGAGTASD